MNEIEEKYEALNTNDRKSLFVHSGNGIIIGNPGEGVSSFVRQSVAYLLNETKDNIIILDSTGQYRDLAQNCKDAEVINLSPVGDYHINPFDMDVWSLKKDGPESYDKITQKGDFICALCEQLMGKLTPTHRVIIDSCVQNMYEKIINAEVRYIPLISDFINELLVRPEDEAKILILALEIMTNGIFDTYNHQTNIESDARLIILDLSYAGTSFIKLVTLITMEHARLYGECSVEDGKHIIIYRDNLLDFIEDTDSNEYFVKLHKQARHRACKFIEVIYRNCYDLGLIHLFENASICGIISNAPYAVIMAVTKENSGDLISFFGVPEYLVEALENSDKSHFGIVMNNNKYISFTNL